MRIPFFGRKKAADSQRAAQPNREGHAHVLRRLRENEQAAPLERPQLAADIVFDFVYRVMAESGRGARIEDLVAIFASVGGFTCILGPLQILASEGKTPQEAGILEIEAKDGNRYFFGDLPNAALWESETALLSLALGAAQACGGEVSADMVTDVMRRVAQSVGSERFGIVEVPEAHRPIDLPSNLVRHFWPKIGEALDLYEISPAQRPIALGFALQTAIRHGQNVIDPALAAKIAIECAVPMAKVDPARFL